MNDAARNAEELFTRLLEARSLITYKGAFGTIFGHVPERWSQGHARRVVAVATRTDRRRLTRNLSGRLDALIVNERQGLPSPGHFEFAPYTKEEWQEAFRGWSRTNRPL